MSNVNDGADESLVLGTLLQNVHIDEKGLKLQVNFKDFYH